MCVCVSASGVSRQLKAVFNLFICKKKLQENRRRRCALHSLLSLLPLLSTLSLPRPALTLLPLYAAGKNNNLQCESLLPLLLLLRFIIIFTLFTLLSSLSCSALLFFCTTFYLRAALLLLPAFMLLYFNLVYLATPYHTPPPP